MIDPDPRLLQQFQASADGALGSVEAQILSAREQFAQLIAGWRQTLAWSGNQLILLQTALIQAVAAKPNDPVLTTALGKVTTLLGTWASLVAGYQRFERPATDAERGQAVSVGNPVVIVVAVAGGAAVIAVSVAGIAWAVANFEKAAQLKSEVEAIQQDPAVAAALARLREAEKPPGNAAGMIVGGVVVVGIVGAGIYWFTRK